MLQAKQVLKHLQHVEFLACFNIPAGCPLLYVTYGSEAKLPPAPPHSCTSVFLDKTPQDAGIKAEIIFSFVNGFYSLMASNTSEPFEKLVALMFTLFVIFIL